MMYKLEHIKYSLKKLKKIKIDIDGKTKNIGIIRLLIFFLTICFGLTAFFTNNILISKIIFIVGAISFVFVSIWQNNYQKYSRVLNKWISIKKSYLARIQLDWNKIKRKDYIDETEFTDLEIDFNIIGDKSLLHLIDFTDSINSFKHLRSLFSTENITLEKINLRQNLVKEISSFNYFREKFLLLSKSSKNHEENNLEKWFNSDSVLDSATKYLKILIPLAIINVVLIVLHLSEILISLWMISSFIYVSIYYLNSRCYRDVGQISDLLKDELSRSIKKYELIESINFSRYKQLSILLKPIKETPTGPTKLLKSVLKILNILSLRSNPFIWLFLALIFPIDFFISYKLEKIKISLKRDFKTWESILNQLDSFISLATFAKLNSNYSYPQIYGDKFLFNANAIGHPLIPKNQKVCNNFEMKNIGGVILITGSNMAGKSTFLRTVGINTCLAYSGSVVNASYFELSVMKLFSCIKVSDSVTDGISYFYGEVKRLKKLIDIFNSEIEIPVLFLIDEIFKGTNNIERRIGSSSYIKSIVGKNGFGFVTTHDIELVHLSDENDQIENYHFKERIIDNKMEFDFILRKGPCPTTNALKIMKIEGLPVSEKL